MICLLIVKSKKRRLFIWVNWSVNDNLASCLSKRLLSCSCVMRVVNHLKSSCLPDSIIIRVIASFVKANNRSKRGSAILYHVVKINIGTVAR